MTAVSGMGPRPTDFQGQRSSSVLRPGVTYGIEYGMHRTTVYLPDDLKRALARVAAARGCSEAELVREALAALAASADAPAPRLPLFESGDATLAERVDDELRGFGER